jgi:hypothetical protein
LQSAQVASPEAAAVPASQVVQLLAEARTLPPAQNTHAVCPDEVATVVLLQAVHASTVDWPVCALKVPAGQAMWSLATLPSQ